MVVKANFQYKWYTCCKARYIMKYYVDSQPKRT